MGGALAVLAVCKPNTEATRRLRRSARNQHRAGQVATAGGLGARALQVLLF